MNGILNILKPPGMTSFDVVAHLRGLLRIRKIGHTGTLDPLAAGVLPLCLGNATRAIEFLMEKDKLYRAELTLGISTDTQDISGNVVSTYTVNCTDEDITNAVRSFTGKYMQLPPMFSALKVDGKKLYDLAREGITVPRNPREVFIYSLNIINIKRCGKVKVLFDIHCSKGTYIRTLCADIGERLGCGGHMSFLLRKRAGMFDISSSLTLEEISGLFSEGRLQEKILNTEDAFGNLEAVKIDRMQEKRFLNGVAIRLENYFSKGLVRVFDENRRFLALGEMKETEGGLVLKSKKFF